MGERRWAGPSGNGTAKTDARNRTRLRKRLRAEGFSEEHVIKTVDELAKQQRNARRKAQYE